MIKNRIFKLDISVGDYIDWFGCEALVEFIDGNIYTLTVNDQTVFADDVEVAAQNEWAILD